jgi:rhodanese-related sulfurtransferase
MGQIISTSLKKIVKEALAAVDSISVQEAKTLVNNDKYQFVDVRELSEQQKVGVIPGAILSSRGMIEFHIDPDSPLHKSDFAQDKTYIFYCASGARSALSAVAAKDMGLSPVVNMAGGIIEWIKNSGSIMDR